MANRRFIDFPIATTVGDNDIVLIWQDGANKQTTKATILSGLPENLEDLNDVVISGLTNGQILRYDSVTGKWVNTDQGNLDLNDLNDVSIVSPSNGQVLVYNSSTSKWENSSGGFVPYVGAVTTVDLGAQGLRAGYVRFDTSVVAVPDEQGLMYWDDARSTVALIMNGTLQHIGQDSFFYVKNSSGSTIPKGTCVGFAGTDGGSGHLLVTPFLANGSVPSTYFMGVTCESIANGAFGQVMHFGELEGINTSGFTAGALLYASSTVAGAFQTTPPLAPNNIILVAAAVNSKNNGAIVVRPTLGSNFNTNESVKLTSVANLDLLQYQSGTGVWENKTLSQVIGSAYVPSTRTLTINGVTQDLSANRTFNVGTVTSVGLSSATSGVTIGSTPVTSSGTITLAIATASGSQQGLLSAADWTTFNNKQNALTNPVTGTGTINYLPKFTGSTTIGNSQVFDNGTLVGIGTANPEGKLTIEGTSAQPPTSGTTANSLLQLKGSLGNELNIGSNTVAGNYGSYIQSSDNNLAVAYQLNLQPTGGNVIIGSYTDNGARLQVNGTATFSGNVGIGTTNSSESLRIIQSTGNASGLLVSTSSVTAGQSYGATIIAGTNSSDASFRVFNQGASTNYFTIRGDGNIGIGTTTPSSFAGYNNLSLQAGSSGYNLDFFNNSGVRGMAIIYNPGVNVNFQNLEATPMDFQTQATTRMRITSGGNVLIGTTTVGYGLFTQQRVSINPLQDGVLIGGLNQNFSAYTVQADNNTGTRYALYIANGSSTPVGYISFTSTATNYVTSSDYRLKTDLKDYNGLDLVSKIKTYDFEWKTDKSRSFGVIAHELQDVISYAVNGNKDGKTMQGVDYSKLVPIMVKAIQELKQEIDTLKN